MAYRTPKPLYQNLRKDLPRMDQGMVHQSDRHHVYPHDLMGSIERDAQEVLLWTVPIMPDKRIHVGREDHLFSLHRQSSATQFQRGADKCCLGYSHPVDTDQVLNQYFAIATGPIQEVQDFPGKDWNGFPTGPRSQQDREQFIVRQCCGAIDLQFFAGALLDRQLFDSAFRHRRFIVFSHIRYTHGILGLLRKFLKNLSGMEGGIG